MKVKSTFDKNKCKTCMYHGNLSGVDNTTIFCNYASLTDSSCLYRKGSHIFDKRGNEPENCKLYEEGAKIRDKSNWQENHMQGMKGL